MAARQPATEPGKPVVRGGRPPRSPRRQPVGNVCGGRPPRRRSTPATCPPSGDLATGFSVVFQVQLGMSAADAAVSSKWLSRNEIGLTNIQQIGLLDECDLGDLTRGLSLIGGKLLRWFWAVNRGVIPNWACHYYQAYCPRCGFGESSCFVPSSHCSGVCGTQVPGA